VNHNGEVSLDERLRCVIVDDNLDFVIAASRLLARQGIAVVGVAHTIPDGLRCIEKAEPAVILVDIDLGSENGFDLVEQLDRNSTTAAPVILISTHAAEDFADMVAASSAVAFVTKSELSGAAIREALGIPE
jgi:CheY-like chemotaxis protein